MGVEAQVAVPRGLYGTDQVDVAYEPWRAVADTALRLGPSPDAGVVPDDDGEPVGLRAGQHFGRQSTRNPRCLDAPPLRGATDGYVWGYCMSPVTNKSGWMRLADLEADRDHERLACGPAGADFDRRDPASCGGHCDGRPLTGVRDASGRRVVDAREVYLRYAPQSTAFRYLVRGDEVRELIRNRQRNWVGVEIQSARFAPKGARGWISASSLR